jgi:hypothetical protein
LWLSADTLKIVAEAIAIGFVSSAERATDPVASGDMMDASDPRRKS